MSEPTKPGDPGDDDRWLEVLAGKRAADARDEKSAADLRQVMLDEYQQAYDDVDEMQLKRLERRIFPARESTSTPAPWRSRSFSTFQAMAASVASLALGALLTIAIVGPGSRWGTEEPELIMTYGAYEDVRGTEPRSSATIAVADPNAVVDELAVELTRQSVPFRIYRLKAGGRLMLIQAPASADPRLAALFSTLGISFSAGIDFELTIEKKKS